MHHSVKEAYLFNHLTSSAQYPLCVLGMEETMEGEMKYRPFPYGTCCLRKTDNRSKNLTRRKFIAVGKLERKCVCTLKMWEWGFDLVQKVREGVQPTRWRWVGRAPGRREGLAGGTAGWRFPGIGHGSLEEVRSGWPQEERRPRRVRWDNPILYLLPVGHYQ